jgi:hypothetical protein
MVSACKEAIITRPKQIDSATPEEKHREDQRITQRRRRRRVQTKIQLFSYLEYILKINA